jgi:hypothetical protein
VASQDLPAAPAPAKIGESRWPMALAVLAAGGLRAALPAELRDGDARWVFAAVIVVLLAVLVADVSAIRPWAKLMMMTEEAISLLVAILVVSRAVNILR